MLRPPAPGPETAALGGGTQRPQVQRGQQARPATDTRRKKSPRRFELGDLATNRVLFALALLGVLLPLNSLVNHYRQLNFIYSVPHAMSIFRGPYHMHGSTAFYIMEIFLAIAVYFYAFDFIFVRRIFERAGTLCFAFSLLVPPFYLYLWAFQKFVDATRGLSTPLYWLAIIAISIPLGFLGYLLPVISNRLEGSG